MKNIIVGQLIREILLILVIAFLVASVGIPTFLVASHAQKQVDDINDIKNAAQYIEVFEYSGHEYLRYKIGKGKIGGLCHKQDCKFCMEIK